MVINTVREVFQSINIDEQPSPVDVAQARNEERLTGTEVNDVPYPNSHSLRSSMKLMPGVPQDPGGGLHFNGSSENQVQYLLNGFNITNPITGQLQTVLAVEGIRSLDYSSARYSPEYGKGSAGVLAIPFSVQQETGVIVGAVNSYRYPVNFDLNLAIERTFTLHRYRFAVRGGVNNLTDQRNPTVVNNVIGSPQYLQFLGYEGRTS